MQDLHDRQRGEDQHRNRQRELPLPAQDGDDRGAEKKQRGRIELRSRAFDHEFARRRSANIKYTVCRANMVGTCVGIGINGDGLDAHFAARAHHTYCYFTAIGDKNTLDGLHAATRGSLAPLAERAFGNHQARLIKESRNVFAVICVTCVADRACAAFDSHRQALFRVRRLGD